MKLNIDLISDVLREHFKIINESIKHEEMKLEQVLLVTDKKIFLESKVYVAEGKNLPQKPLIKGPFALVSIGTAPDSYIRLDCDYIEIEENANLLEVINCIQKAYDIYGKWNDRLQEACRQGGNIQDLLEITAPLLENPIYLHDKDFHFVAYEEIPGMPGGSDIYGIEKSGGRFSLKSINELRDTPNFEKTFETTKPTFHIDTGECSYIYDNVWVNSTYWGRLFVDERNRSFKRSDFAIIGKLRHEIEVLLENQRSINGNGVKLLEQELRKLLDDKPIDFNIVEKEIKDREWKRVGRYYCFQIKIEEVDLRLNTKVNICENIESRLKNSFLFTYSNNVIGIVYAENENVLNDIEKCLQPFSMHAGISVEFQDFYDFPVYYRQTSIAIEYGTHENSYCWIHRFENHVFSYMMDCFLKEFEPEAFYPTSLVKLMEHDKEKSTSYVETLRSYLENDLSPARAMKELFVQRSTFLYRLERINEIMETDFKDPKVKLQYLLAFQLKDRWNMINNIYMDDDSKKKGI